MSFSCHYAQASLYIDAIGDVFPCCYARGFPIGNLKTNSLEEILNGQSRIAMLDEMSAGRVPKACYTCADYENKGLPSPRMQAGHFVEDRGVYQIEKIELKMSNLCNFRCRMCYAGSSSRWSAQPQISLKYRTIDDPNHQYFNESLRQHHLDPDYTTWANPDSIERVANFIEKHESLNKILFSGGEPFIQPEQFELIRQISRGRRKTLSLFYSTNLSHLRYQNRVVNEYWEGFESIRLQISVDGIGDVYNFIRDGGNFERLVENLRELLKWKNRPQLGIQFTVQAYNIFQIPEVILFFQSEFPKVPVYFNYLQYPTFLSCRVFPSEIKALIEKRLQNSLVSTNVDVEKTIAFMKSADGSNELDKFKSYTKDLEALASGSFEEIFSSYIR